MLPCFGIALGLGELAIKQICEQKGISLSLFLLVCNVYTFDDYLPEPNSLEQISLKDLMGYLRNSHKDYLENKIPKIISQILDLGNHHDVEHGKMLNEFCEKYRKEVISHFNYEENIVFPYIEKLLVDKKIPPITK